MIFSCDTADLSRALSIVGHSLAVRSPKPILEGVLMESCDEGIRLICTDLSLGIETVFPATIQDEGRVVMPGKLFCDVVRKLPGGQATLNVGERWQTTISCQTFRMTIAGLDPVEYPELPEVKGESFSMEQGKLRGMIGGTLFATAVDESRPILTGCLMEMDCESLTMVALDGFRLALRKEAVHGPDHSCQAVLGGKVLGDISKILDESEEPVTICTSRSHVEMRIGPTHIVARTLEGEFIRYRQILPTEWKTSTVVSRRELDSAIDRASLIAREAKSNLVRFHIDDEELCVTSNSETSDTEERILVRTVGASLAISFNVRYITDVLRVLSDDELVMRFNSEVSPCVICPEHGDAYLYLVLPVRVFAS